MGQHHTPVEGRLGWVARHADRIVLAWLNLAAATACAVDQPGTSPSLRFLASVTDLRWWTILFAAAAAGQILGQVEAADVAGLTGWVMLAYATVAALVTESTPSPSGSIIGAGLMVTAVLRHALGLGHAITTRRAGT